MRYIRTVIVTVGTSQISKERKHFVRKTVWELLSFKFTHKDIYIKKNETNLSVHHQGYRRSVEDPTQGKFYLLGHPCFSISLSQQPGTVEYTWSSFLDLGSFFGRQFFDRQGWGKVLGCFKCSPFIVHYISFFFFFPGGSVGKESACSVGDPGSISGWGRSPGEGNDSPLQYSCLKNSMDWGTWWATKGWTQLSDRTLISGMISSAPPQIIRH